MLPNPDMPDPDPRRFRAAVRATDTARARAKTLRRESSPPEKKLWSRLRRTQLAGLRFRRQHPLGPYIADFYCHAARLVVETDGSTHRHERRLHDARRDEWMNERGIHVLRIPAREIETNLQGVLTTIARLATERS